MRNSNACHALVMLLLASAAARAACPIDIAHFRVGADPTYCSHANIQAAINAAGTCPVIIEVTREHLYGGGYCDPTQPSGCHLAISGKSVTLQGRADGETCYALTQCIPGPSCPAPSSTTPQVTLDGGNSGGRVLSISGGSNVNIRNLTITHGAPGAGASGGGIDFTGFGNLNITRSTIATNSAGYGGGISVSASGGTVNLRLQGNTLIQNNTAEVSGGGIRVEGSTRLFALFDQTLITFNHALGAYGGGIEIIGPARADLGSPGYNGAGVVSNNDGIYGAGIAVVDNGNGNAVLRTFADSASRPTVIENNSGAIHGGGVFATGEADVCLFASRVADNIAEDGSAVFRSCRPTNLDSCANYAAGSNAGLFINDDATARPGTQCGPETVATLGGKATCLPGDEDCGAVDGNLTQHQDASPSAGSTITGYGAFVIRHLRMRDNVAYSGMNAGGGGPSLYRCLIADNFFSGPALEFGGGTGRLHACTITHNVIDDAFVLKWDFVHDVDIAYNIIDQPPRYTVNWLNYGGGGSFDVSYTMSNRLDGLPQNNPSIVQGVPSYVDAANRDYHLKAIDQTALDFGGASSDEDLDGKDPQVDLPGVSNFLGLADLGAYERQNMFYNCGTNDSVFCNGFEH